MSIYGVKVGFMGDKQDKVLYHKYYEIYEESAEKADFFLFSVSDMVKPPEFRQILCISFRV